MKSLKYYLRLSLILFGFFFSLSSCRDIDEFIQNEKSNIIITDRNKVLNSFNELKANSAIFEFSNDKGFTYYFNDGSFISFKPNSFVLNGNQLGSKTLKVVVERVLNKKEMLENSVGTNSGDEVLISAGMFNVRAFYENKALELANGMDYQIRLVYEKPFSSSMELFYGEEKSSGLNWVEADGNPNVQNNVSKVRWEDSSRVYIGIECFPKRLNWVNFDYFAKFTTIERAEPCIQPIFPNRGDSIILQVFCVFKSLNSVITPCCSGSGIEVCFGPLPVGEEVRYIVIGKGKHDYYLGSDEKTIISNDKFVINTEVKSLQEIKEFLSKL